ncbi:MAG: HAD-IIA family hydrolase [Eubacteriales bacterium]
MAVSDIGKIENWLLDMDGTIYLGEKLIPGTLEFLETVRNRGGRYIFLTNNSSKSPRLYAEKLCRLGIEAGEEEVFTSGDAAAQLLEQRFGAGASGFVLGTPALEDLMRSHGFRLSKEGEKADFVLLGFDTTLTYDKIRVACAFIKQGVPFFATHPDLLCPTDKGSVPDAGAMTAMFEKATGVSPQVAGKPESTMARAAFARYGIAPEKTAMVGDRLSTDIAFANRAGLTAVLVLSGETSEADYAAQSEVRADFVFPSVAELEKELSKA